MASLHRRLGALAMIGGVFVVLLSLAGGFYLLLTDQDEGAKRLLPLVPIGFLLIFTGLVASLFSGSPRDDHR